MNALLYKFWRFFVIRFFFSIIVYRIWRKKRRVVWGTCGTNPSVIVTFLSMTTTTTTVKNPTTADASQNTYCGYSCKYIPQSRVTFPGHRQLWIIHFRIPIPKTFEYSKYFFWFITHVWFKLIYIFKRNTLFVCVYVNFWKKLLFSQFIFTGVVTFRLIY